MRWVSEGGDFPSWRKVSANRLNRGSGFRQKAGVRGRRGRQRIAGRPCVNLYFVKRIQPANILIDRQGQAYLTDFGIAVVEEDLLREVAAAGTLAYMAPEQRRVVSNLVAFLLGDRLPHAKPNDQDPPRVHEVSWRIPMPVETAKVQGRREHVYASFLGQ
jgi:hypothetical protein